MGEQDRFPGRVVFDATGEAQAFEDVERYRARRIRDRFNREVLIEYLAAFGVDPDDPDPLRRGRPRGNARELGRPHVELRCHAA